MDESAACVIRPPHIIAKAIVMVAKFEVVRVSIIVGFMGGGLLGQVLSPQQNRCYNN
jgi:ABC-type phosphate/phosphonate transport system permease subunit